ncbi:hypothetical protein E2C01_090053 [Portunus trituberculatus]|uniref:Uncharacterized protein n=1 Tax=Portunus trituberculatus TaxID=210409 RepID=A0A5B7JR80_PORTR|nr:hypothetical protein [Portunus trituberculatus]
MMFPPSLGKLSVALETITVIANLNDCHLSGGVRLSGCGGLWAGWLSGCGVLWLAGWLTGLLWWTVTG